MGRGRLAMKLIEKEKSRKATFQKRKNGIMKKAHELSTLCGVDCCLVVYGPNSVDNLPEIWPRDPREVHRIIKKYEVKIAEKSPKKYNVMEFFKDRKNKVEAEASKLQKERLRKLYPTWDSSFDRLDEEHLRMFVALLDSKIEDCKGRINMLKKKRYIEEKQGAESSQLKSTSNNRSHLSFMHNNTTSFHQTLDFPPKSDDDDHHHCVMMPFHPNLMHLNDSGTQNEAFGPYDPRDSCPSSCFYNINGYYPYLHQNNNVMQHHHEANLQVLQAPLMMQEFQTKYGYHHDLLQAHEMFNCMGQKK
ncbi:agamous-like MADS-box protein AGL8 [Prosopis cineraria]|uniref:agamous-like MADS-box protein AGL8 n=1 Tax=Prosopis cineraria TaxID=364024 RepID=UPI0024108E3A|nr:agamous-like MADS-box protein AGL8 [Prosopis cineraria]